MTSPILNSNLLTIIQRGTTCCILFSRQVNQLSDSSHLGNIIQRYFHKYYQLICDRWATFAMSDISSIGELLTYALDGLFDNFSDESLRDVDD